MVVEALVEGVFANATLGCQAFAAENAPETQRTADPKTNFRILTVISGTELEP